jgi:hypothetical protein
MLVEIYIRVNEIPLDKLKILFNVHIFSFKDAHLMLQTHAPNPMMLCPQQQD